MKNVAVSEVPANKINILYAGLDANTLSVLLEQEDFFICGVSRLDKFSHFTLNPFNLLFKAIYALRTKNIFRPLELFMASICSGLSFLSTGPYKRYSQYLNQVVSHKLDVLDFDNSDLIVSYVRNREVDLLVVCSWYILSAAIIQAPKYKTINIHPSKLPQYRGSLPTLWSLKNHDKETAVSFMVLAPAMDTGDILAQYPIELTPSDDWKTVEDSIATIVTTYLSNDIRKYIKGEKILTPQDNTIASKTLKYDEYLQINWAQEPCRDIYNKVNAYPFLDYGIYCYTFEGEQKIEFYRTRCKEPAVGMAIAPGSFKVIGRKLFVGATDGCTFFNLFSDFAFGPSLKFLFIRSGKFK